MTVLEHIFVLASQVHLWVEIESEIFRYNVLFIYLFIVLNYMVCFKYEETTWWIWLGLTNTKTTSLEMKMLSPENRMSCDSNVIKQVNYIFLQCNTMQQSRYFGTLMQNVISLVLTMSLGYKDVFFFVVFPCIALCDNSIPGFIQLTVKNKLHINVTG